MPFSNLSLDIGKFFVNGTVFHPKYIDSSDMLLFPSCVHPAETPTQNAPLTEAENLLDLDMGMGRLAEEVLPILSYDFLPHVYSAVWSGMSVFKDAIVTHKLHHTGDIMTVESLIELKDNAYCCFNL
jgi:hypothetical protein